MFESLTALFFNRQKIIFCLLKSSGVHNYQKSCDPFFRTFIKVFPLIKNEFAFYTSTQFSNAAIKWCLELVHQRNNLYVFYSTTIVSFPYSQVFPLSIIFYSRSLWKVKLFKNTRLRYSYPSTHHVH